MGKRNLYLKSIMIKALLSLFIIALIGGCSSDQINNAAIPTDKLQYDWWKNRHQKVIDSLVTNPQLILIGNSILNQLDSKDRKDVWKKYLDQYKTLNLGFSGDRTENVIWRLQNGEIDNINPKVALLLIGTNNTDGCNYPTITHPVELSEAIWEICSLIRKKDPDTNILLMGILPYGRNLPNYRDSINKKTNELISLFPKRDKKIHYIYIGDSFLNSNGKIIKELMPDFLHPNAAGHMLMFDKLEAKITELMGK